MRITSLLLALSVLAVACGGGSGADEDAQNASETTTSTSTPSETPDTTSAPATTTSTTAEPSDTNVFTIRQGDCLSQEIADEQSSVPTVPCDQPHDSEVYTTFALADGPYPGNESVDTQAGEGCLAQFEPTFRESYDVSPYFISYLFPTETSWNNEDDREVLCLASGSELLTGSVVPERNSDPALAAAIAVAIVAPGEDGQPSPFGVEDASCAASWIVNDVGTQRLMELGISAAGADRIDNIDFSEEELEVIVLALGDCADLPRLIADSLVDDGTFTQADGDCFAVEFDELVLEQAFKVRLRDSSAEIATDEFLAEFLNVASTCNINL